MLLKTDDDSVFDGETVLVRAYWDLKPRVREKLAKHIQFTPKTYDLTISPHWLWTGVLPLPLVLIDPLLILTCVGQCALVYAYGVTTDGKHIKTKRPKAPQVEVIKIRDDARWNALEDAFTPAEWERFTQDLSSDTDTCKALAEIVYRYMDKTENLLEQRKIAVEIEAEEQVASIDDELRTAGQGGKHAITCEWKRIDDELQELQAGLKAEAEQLRLGQLNVLDSNIEIAREETAEFRLLAEQARYER